MKKKRILLLAGNTLRSRSYAQNLKMLNDIDVCGLFYGFNYNSPKIPTLNHETKKYLINNNIIMPNFNETLEQTFNNLQWNFKYLETNDVNSEDILSTIGNYDADLIVFAGYGGQILQNVHFLSSTPYLHMHPGFLPIEKGSTTIYYSILNQRNCTVTAFIMNADIDAGEIVFRKEYEVPNKNVDIDQYFDNSIRGDCLRYTIKNLDNKCENDLNANSEEYYIIHPVLKHVALLSLK